MQKFGIDISRWQGDFNFDAALKDGVEFVIVKGGGGDAGLYVDSKFNRNYAEAKKKNLPVGVYWFSKAVTIAEAEKEADYFIENCLKGRQYELPVYIDVEHEAQHSLGKRKLTDIVKAWLNRVESRGYWVGIYSTKYWFESYMIDSELKPYAHWIAQWNTTCTYPNEYGMWQFGGETNLIRANKVAGVVCDQNYMLVDYPSLIKAAGLNGFKKPAAAKPTATKPVTPKPETPKPVTGYKKYTVKQGDSLWSIAASQLGDGTRYNEIKELNGLKSDMIHPNWVLRIPTTGATASKEKTYTVKSGDSLWAIAASQLGNGARYEEIKKLNGLKSDMIYAGQTLKIPAK